MKIKSLKQLAFKMHLLLGVLLCIAIWANAGTEIKKQQVPKEVQEIIDNYFKDTASGCSFEKSRKYYNVDPSIQLADLETGTPIQAYHFVHIDSLEKINENSPVKAFATPANVWTVPIRIHQGKYIYSFTIVEKSGFWCAVGTSGWDNELWQKIKKYWPESSGYYPVIVTDGRREFLHFPNKDDHNLLYLMPGYLNDSLSMIVPRGYDSLTDSRTILRFLKKEIPQTRESNRLFRKEFTNE